MISCPPPPRLGGDDDDNKGTQDRARRSRSLLHCTHCKCYLYNGPLLPPRSYAAKQCERFWSAAAEELPHSAQTMSRFICTSHNKLTWMDLVAGRCGGSHCKEAAGDI